MAGPCDDLRIIDLSSGPVGGIATMVLADFGADVIKVERPGGDPFRRLASAPMWLRGKRSVELDLSSHGGRQTLRRLAQDADAVVASFRPGRAAPLGADYATLAERNAGLIYCSITGWGPQGPYASYPGYEGLVAAKSGRMRHFAALPRREGPVYAAVQTGSHAASQSAVAGILAAALVRERTGEGQLVETSVLQGLLPYDLRQLVWKQLAERYPAAFAANPFFAPPPQPTLQYQPVMTKDGRWIQLANLLEHHFHTYIDVAGLGEIWADPEMRFLGAPRDLEDDAREELRELMLNRMRERTADEWMALFMENGNVAAEPFNDTAGGLEQPDMLANGEIVTIEDPRLGAVRQLGPIARFSSTPASIGRPAPEVGEHTAEVLSEPRRARSTAERPTAERPTPGRPAAVGSGDENGAAASRPRGPLDGVTVLEFATIIAAPLGCSLLADLGARVIKVEPTGGDPYRGMGVGAGSLIPVSKTTAGKESICIDLKAEASREIVRRLIERADVLVHNYRPGVPERLGIGYEQVRELNPAAVYVHVFGYGPDGPSARRPSAHPLPGAVLGGALHQAGAAMPPATVESLDEIREAGRWLFRANEANPDPNTSMVILSATLIGLHARSRTGDGQQIQLSMLGANAYANSDDFLDYAGKPPRAPVDAELYGVGALYRLYEARDGWLFLAAPSEHEWAALAAALERIAGVDLRAEPRFADAAARKEHEAELSRALAAVFEQRDAAEWERLLIAAGVGCVEAGAVDTGTFLLEDEHAAVNGFAPTAHHALWGDYRRWGPTVTFSDTPSEPGAGAMAGEHTDALLAELGFDAPTIEELRDAGVVASEPIEFPAE